MGYFVVPSKPREECDAEEYVKTALANLKLLQQSPDCDYLFLFIQGYLQDALKEMK